MADESIEAGGTGSSCSTTSPPGYDPCPNPWDDLGVSVWKNSGDFAKFSTAGQEQQQQQLPDSNEDFAFLYQDFCKLGLFENNNTNGDERNNKQGRYQQQQPRDASSWHPTQQQNFVGQQQHQAYAVDRHHQQQHRLSQDGWMQSLGNNNTDNNNMFRPIEANGGQRPYRGGHQNRTLNKHQLQWSNSLNGLNNDGSNNIKVSTEIPYSFCNLSFPEARSEAASNRRSAAEHRRQRSLAERQ